MIIILLLLVGLFLHELGHYFTAKRQGNYNGWGILPTPHIKLTHIFKNRWNYLEGIAFSLPLVPILHLVGLVWWKGLILMVGIGILDIFVFLFYKRVK